MFVKEEEKTFSINEKQIGTLTNLRENLENGLVSKKSAALTIKYLVEDVVGF